MRRGYIFQDRAEAGQELAQVLKASNLKDPVVLALPRGGVPVAREIAIELKTSLDVLIVRKIGAPFNLEYGIGAMSEDFQPLFSPSSKIYQLDYGEEIKMIVHEEKQEALRRIRHYRGHRDLPPMKERTVIIVDDGIATGITATVGAKYLKSRGAAEIIVAVPVCPPEDDPWMLRYIDRIIALERPSGFSGVGQWYSDFSQVTDQQVLRILREFHPEGELYV